MNVRTLPQRSLGATGVTTTALGLGGEGILRTYGYDSQARAVIGAALEEGVSYFDSARAYAGSERYYGASLGSARDGIFLTSKAHDRSRRGALAMLDQTLDNMRTSHLDLWQLHDLRTYDELERISAPGGAYEAFEEAKQSGKARFIGITGHYDPAVLEAAIGRLRFDSVLLPVNPCEGCAASFCASVGRRASALGMAVIGMKVFSRGLFFGATDVRLQELVDYALSQPVDVIIIGCDSVEQVKANARAAGNFQPMSEDAQRTLERRLRAHVDEMLYYRGSV